MSRKTLNFILIFNGIWIAFLIAYLLFTHSKDNPTPIKPVSMKPYILAAFRLVGNEVLVHDREFRVTTSNRKSEGIVVAFLREWTSDAEDGRVVNKNVLARVSFTQKDICVEPESLIVKAGRGNNDNIRLRVALVAVSYILENAEDTRFDLYISEPTKTGYWISYRPVPYRFGGEYHGDVINRSGKLEYIPSPYPNP